MKLFPILKVIQMAKICSKCKVPKNDEEYSFAKGKDSDLRKTYCKECEYLTRNAKSHGVSAERLAEIVKNPCCLCKSHKSKIYTVDEQKYVLCLQCYNWLDALKRQRFDSQEMLNLVCIFIMFPVIAKQFAVMTDSQVDELKQLRLKYE